jgi:hypothetical protein
MWKEALLISDWISLLTRFRSLLSDNFTLLIVLGNLVKNALRHSGFSDVKMPLRPKKSRTSPVKFPDNREIFSGDRFHSTASATSHSSRTRVIPRRVQIGRLCRNLRYRF